MVTAVSCQQQLMMKRWRGWKTTRWQPSGRGKEEDTDTTIKLRLAATIDDGELAVMDDNKVVGWQSGRDKEEDTDTTIKLR